MQAAEADKRMWCTMKVDDGVHCIASKQTSQTEKRLFSTFSRAATAAESQLTVYTQAYEAKGVGNT